MKIQIQVSPTITAQVEGNTQVEVFEELARLQEIFGQSRCGKCKSQHLKFVVREVDDNKYYELQCIDCRAALSFGQHKKGGSLFPKRKAENEDGTTKWLPNDGWTKWNAEKKIKE